MGKENGVNPYDLGSVGRWQSESRNRRQQEEQARQARIAARIRRIESFGGHVNPYDLGQMAEIFELDKPRRWW